MARSNAELLPPRFDAFDLGLLADPYPAYARLRAAGALCRGGPGQWLVPRYAQVHALLRDQRLGQFQFPDAYRLFPAASLRNTLGDGPASTFTQRIVAGRDRPEHTQLRRLLGQVFSPSLVEGLRGRVGEWTDQLLAPAIDRGHLDGFADLAFPLPLLLLGELLGLPAADRDEVGRRVLRLTKIFAPTVAEDGRAAADDAVHWLRGYVDGLLRARLRAPREDLLSKLAAAARAGQLGREETVDNAIFLVFAGFETSLNLIATGCVLLSRHPGEFDRLRAEPGLAPRAVEEFLRFDAPTQLTGRIVLERLEIADHPVRKGRVVLLLLGSANHDDRQFAEPDRLDVGRDPNPHVSFGGGIHYCLGAALARLEGAVVFERLARRLRTIEPAGEPVREHSATLRAYAQVPLRVAV